MLEAEQKANVTANALGNTQLQAAQFYSLHSTSEANALQETGHKEHVSANRIENEANTDFQSMQIQLERPHLL